MRPSLGIVWGIVREIVRELVRGLIREPIRGPVRGIVWVPVWLLLAGSIAARPQTAAAPAPAASSANTQASPQTSLPTSPGAVQNRVLARVLDNEIAAARGLTHPMRYRLTKTTPRLSTTREIYETREGGVARLLAIDGRPLAPAAQQQEQARLEELLGDAARQRHRGQAEDADRQRALKILSALPSAFLYRYIGPGQGSAGPVERFSFRPNPAFAPPDLETQVLAAMSGEIWIDPAAMRAVCLQARLDRDVAFGWGLLGRLNRGGSIRIDQAQVAPGVWRTVRLQLAMTGRVLFRARRFDTLETMSDFAPLPPAIGYRQAVAELLATPPPGSGN